MTEMKNEKYASMVCMNSTYICIYTFLDICRQFSATDIINIISIIHE